MKRRFRKTQLLISAVILLAAVIAAYLIIRGRQSPYISDTEFLLNTVCTISLYDKQDETTLRQAFEVISHYENLLSTTIAGSDIYKINHAAGAPVKVNADTIEVIDAGIRYSEESGGLFDITVGALTALWNIEGENPRVPPEAEIRAAMKTINYKNIIILGDTVTLKDKQAQLDLGGVAKGYIADKVRDYLRSKGVHRAIINLGGNVEVIGSKDTGKPWVVGVQQPFMERNELVGYLYVTDQSVVTSGIYERYFIQDGKTYAHILDPRTGYPVDNNLNSVTIISDNSKQGDGLAASCFLLGIDKAAALIESLGLEAIFITKDGKVVTTSGIGEKVRFEPIQTETPTVGIVAPT